MTGVLGRCTRHCMGRATSDFLVITLSLAVLHMTLPQRLATRQFSHHSDRGVQYVSESLPSKTGNGKCHPQHEPTWYLP